MVRAARRDAPDTRHHVFNRGIAKRRSSSAGRTSVTSWPCSPQRPARRDRGAPTRSWERTRHARPQPGRLARPVHAAHPTRLPRRFTARAGGTAHSFAGATAPDSWTRSATGASWSRTSMRIRCGQGWWSARPNTPGGAHPRTTGFTARPGSNGVGSKRRSHPGWGDRATGRRTTSSASAARASKPCSPSWIEGCPPPPPPRILSTISSAPLPGACWRGCAARPRSPTGHRPAWRSCRSKPSTLCCPGRACSARVLPGRSERDVVSKQGGARARSRPRTLRAGVAELGAREGLSTCSISRLHDLHRRRLLTDPDMESTSTPWLGPLAVWQES